jgi:predicted HicB family RNase H-like nuclease
MAKSQKSGMNPVVNHRRAAPDAELPARSTEAKTQLGARISEAKYRQLKLAAVLRGVTVQVLVEQAIEEFLTNHPELLQSSLVAAHPAKSTPRRPR